MKLQLIKKGNLKIHRNTGIFSLPTSVCRAQCPGCYAKKAERLYPAVLPFRNRCYEASILPDFETRIIAEIQHAKVPFFRIHESGDFYSLEYFQKWQRIAQALPEIRFYCYTKNGYSSELANLNIIDSLTPLGMNYGNADHIDALKAIGYQLCPCRKGSTIKCMLDCQLCLTESKICILKH